VAHSKSHPEFNGKYINDIAVAMGIEDPLDALRKIILDDEGTTLGASGAFREEDLIAVLKASFTSIGSDSSVLDAPPPPEKLTSPRSYGSFSIVLDRYVRQLGILSWEEAIRKMTSLVANRIGLRDRGVLREGNWADIVVFDPKSIKNNATWETPTRYPDGIPYVLVNGQMVIDEGEHTGLLAGKVLTHYTKKNHALVQNS
jgi:N-acyl-D-amino-acid deacylase